MTSTEPRRGIERKILTSILWVGIIPLSLALVTAHLTVRWGQSSSVQNTLRLGAYDKGTALRIGLEAFAEASSENLPSLTALLMGDPTATSASLSPGGGHVLARQLWKADGRTLVAASDGATGAQVLPREWYERVHARGRSTLVSFGYDVGRQRYEASVLSPVYAEDGRKIIGYLLQSYDASSEMPYLLGLDGAQAAAWDEAVRYEILVDGDAGMVGQELARDAETGLVRFAPDAPASADKQLAESIRAVGAVGSGSRALRGFTSSSSVGSPLSVLIAWHDLVPGQGVYLVSYRPASAVFWTLNWVTLLAIVASVVLVGVFLMLAFRNVHNNIVRPVLLLNEGAQIIGQGDLDLKLIIRTSDEIEETAMSFNKMALALKENIGQLQASEDQYRSLVTSMRDGIFQADSDMVIGFLNPTAMDILGYARDEEAVGENLEHMFLEEQELARVQSQIRSTGFVERTRIWLTRQDGRAICVELSCNQIKNDDGDVIGIEGIFRDVTKNVRLEREARERAERLSAINQIANVINSSLEAGRLFESLVVEVKKLVDFDYAALALLDEDGKSFAIRTLWPEQEDAPRLEQSVDDPNAAATWVLRQRECLIVDDLQFPESPFANQFPATARSCMCVPLYASGRIIGTFDLAAYKPHAFSRHDMEVLEQMAPHVAVAIGNADLLNNLQQSLEAVTRAREDLHAANEELKSLDEMKTNLLSNVSHELRTPLVSVMGYTDMIFNEKVGPINDVQRDYLSISLRNVEKLVTLIENLLDFSRLHRGAETLVFGTFDLVDCAKQSMQIVQPVADSRDIRLIINAPEAISVEGDKGKLGQVFNNLLSNAVKFNEPGGSVTVTITPSDSVVDVRVTDTGIGIPQDSLDNVFTRFYQVDSSSTRKYGGTGIGLSIAQDIVRLHGSRISASSEVGKGTEFRFSLPLQASSSRDLDTPALDEESAAETHMLIGVLSKDRPLVSELRTLLDAEGMDLIHATTPSHARSLCTRHRPNCMLVDLEETDEGSAVLEELFKEGEEIPTPVIALTANDALYEKYRDRVAARLARGYRKSSLLSSITYALSHDKPPADSLGGRVLCVDDDTEILTFVSRCLEGDGYSTQCCKSGDEALELVGSGEFGVVLLDIAMPGIDGWETCRRIKADPNLEGIKVYMVTAKPVDTELPRVQEAQADGYLMKPFRAEDLLTLVHGLAPSQVGGEA
jgi:PAS domain S-box-containing protein